MLTLEVDIGLTKKGANMNLANGTLIFLGFLSIVLGITSKLMGTSLLTPFVEAPSTYLIIAITCFVVALVIDKYEKK